MGILPQSTSGVYQIENTINGHKYIGSSVDMTARWNRHLSLLRNNKHDNIHLQRAWNKYGERAFAFSILEICFSFMLVSKEQEFLDQMKPEYNICQIANSILGYKHTSETRTKISLAKKGLKRGKLSPETCAKISEAQKGALNHNFGKHHPERPVYQYTIGLRFLAEYQNVIAAKEATGASGIGDCCNGKRNSSGGFIWKWKYRFPPHRDGPESPK